MSDLTLLYYSAGVIDERFARNVRRYLFLRSMNQGFPIISVTQQPLDFGENVCVGEIGVSPYNVYRQILAGAEQAKTRLIACCEDDTIYSAKHFELEIDEDAFNYSMKRWLLDSRGEFWWRNRATMNACIVARDLLVDTLRVRFAKHPKPPPGREAWEKFGEPGRCEAALGLPPVRMTRPWPPPDGRLVTVNHHDSLGGKRRVLSTDMIETSLPEWGDARKLWDDLHG